MAKYCENCGSKVFSIGCVNCDEKNYIAEQSCMNEKDEHWAAYEKHLIEKGIAPYPEPSTAPNTVNQQ